MSDEERKAIERLIIYKDKIKDELYPIIDFEEEKAIGIVLNIIEKQSKEIEEYKKQLDLDYVDKHFVPVERYNQLEKEIEELKRENLEIRDWKYVIDSPIDLDKLKELDLIKIKGKEYISVDKIKAKIEEVEQWELYNMKIPRLSTLDERLGAKIGIKYVLQSLLEKE